MSNEPAILVRTMRAEHWEEAEKCLLLGMSYIDSAIGEMVITRTEGRPSVKDRILLDGMRADLERVRNSILQIRDDKSISSNGPH